MDPWAFVGWGQSLAGGPSGYTVPQGYGGVLGASNDPALGAVLARARALGANPGIFIETPYAEQLSPQAYAQRAVNLANQYGVNMIVPDIEGAMSHGGPGSPSWVWSQQAAQAIRQMAPNLQVAMTTEHAQDMNYGAWTGIGANIWGQSYAGDMAPFDPNETYQHLLQAGVPADRASVVLAPGQSFQGPAGAAFSLDLMQRTGRAPTFTPGVVRPPPVMRPPTVAGGLSYSAPPPPKPLPVVQPASLPGLTFRTV